QGLEQFKSLTTDNGSEFSSLSLIESIARSISRVIANAYEAVGIHSSKITPHSLRHTAATLSLINGGV
ncbi:UNVERIFIED_CONTAM: hypothetical protein QML36_10810, partial [Aerococcus urinaeequi]